jgi:hypothetical protein
MSSPSIVEGETSSSGKTIEAPHPTKDGKTYRLDAETILSGESEYRDSRAYEIFTPKRFQKVQRANHAPGPQAGCNGVSDADNLPESTHVPDGEEAYPESDESDAESDDTQDVDEDDEDDESARERDMLDMQDWERTDVIAVEGVGELLITRLQQTRTSPPTTTGAEAVDRAGEEYKIRTTDTVGAPVLIIESHEDSGPVVMLDEADKYGRGEIEHAGQDADWLRRWIRDDYHGDGDDSDSNGGNDGGGDGPSGDGTGTGDTDGESEPETPEIRTDGGSQTSLTEF